MTHLNTVPQDELLAATIKLATDERRIVANVIAHLIAIEERRVHLDLAYSSLYDFCHRALGMSESTARRRAKVAKIVSKFPALLEAYEKGQLHLSGIERLAKVLTPENFQAVLEEAKGRTTRQIEELVAKLAPKPDVPAEITRLPEQSRDGVDGRDDRVTPTATLSRSVSPLSPERYRLQMTVDAELREEIERIQALMRHRNPSGDLVTIFKAAMAALRKDLEKERLGKVETPRPAKPPKDPGHVSQATRREVFARDGEQCSFVGPNGERCPARAFLEIDHRDARARGGKGDADNSRVFCQAHNLREAEKAFGRKFIEARIQRAKARTAESPKARPTLPPLPLALRPVERPLPSSLIEVSRAASPTMALRNAEASSSEHSPFARPCVERPTGNADTTSSPPELGTKSSVSRPNR